MHWNPYPRTLDRLIHVDVASSSGMSSLIDFYLNPRELFFFDGTLKTFFVEWRTPTMEHLISYLIFTNWRHQRKLHVNPNEKWTIIHRIYLRNNLEPLD
jgi:hypothetical protein